MNLAAIPQRFKTIRTNFFVTLGMYMLKVTSKFIVGLYSGSMSMVTDAIHNTMDVFELCLINWGLKVSRTEKHDSYPLGLSPVQNLIAVLIGFGLIVIALSALKELAAALYTIAASHYAILSSDQYLITRYLSSLIENEHLEPNNLLLPIAVFFSSFILSRIVAVYEKEVAKIEDSKGLKADAEELEMDSFVELGAGGVYLLIFIFHGLHTIAPGIPELPPNGVTLIDALLNIFIAGVAFYTGFEIINENIPGLLNKAIPKEDQKLIYETIENINGIEELVKPISAFYRGDDIIVLGTIRANNGVKANNIAFIQKFAERLTQNCLSEKKSRIYYSVSLSHPDSADFDSHYSLYLSVIFSIDSYENPQYIELLRKSNKSLLKQVYDDASSLVNSTNVSDTHKAFLFCILFDTLFFLGNKYHDELNETMKSIRQMIKDGEISHQARKQLMLKLMFFEVESLRSGVIDHDIVNGIREQLTDIARDERIDPLLRGEASFYLGRSYFKSSLYDLDQMQHWMQEAITFYNCTSFPINKDRVLNDWGHMETFFYNIASGNLYLEQSGVLKEMKQDESGLAFTKGCLADSRIMEGRFEEGISLYQEDLDLIERSGTSFNRDGVKIKLAEAIIKNSIRSNSNDHDIRIETLLSNLDYPSSFFALKARFKHYYYKYWQNSGNTAALSHAKSTLNSMQGNWAKLIDQNQYIASFYNLYSARIALTDNDIDAASSFYQKSIACLVNSIDWDFPVQSIITELEKTRYELEYMDRTESRYKALSHATEKLYAFFKEKGTEVGNAFNFIIPKCKKIQEAINEKKIEDAFLVCDKLIWFLEK